MSTNPSRDLEGVLETIAAVRGPEYARLIQHAHNLRTILRLLGAGMPSPIIAAQLSIVSADVTSHIAKLIQLDLNDANEQGEFDRNIDIIEQHMHQLSKQLKKGG